MNTTTKQTVSMTARLLAAGVFTTASGLSASGLIVGTAGPVAVIGPPADTMPGGVNESNVTVFAFNEKQGEPIAGPTPVNMIGVPQTITADPGIQGVLLPGIDVDSHLIELDPFVGLANINAAIEFDSPIVGVQVLRRQLDETDYLGAPGTVYPTPPMPGSVPRRGLDWDATGTEMVTISPSRTWLRFDLYASNAIDHIRVLTSNQRPRYDIIKPPILPGDTDGDGDIDDADLGTAFSNYTGPKPLGTGGMTPADGDTDGDGDVDDADLGTAFAGYTGPLAPAAVPEPGSLALIGLGSLLVARRRRG
ncbi:MAG: PEP-CTERM sorting domain-containing protein [Phycisphaeraceae bacterium]